MLRKIGEMTKPHNLQSRSKHANALHNGVESSTDEKCSIKTPMMSTMKNFHAKSTLNSKIPFLRVNKTINDEDHGMKLDVVEKELLRELISEKLQQLKDL